MMFLMFDQCPFAAQYRFLSFKYDSNQSPADPLIPYARNFSYEDRMVNCIKGLLEVQKYSQVDFPRIHVIIPVVSATY